MAKKVMDEEEEEDDEETDEELEDEEEHEEEPEEETPKRKIVEPKEPKAYFIPRAVSIEEMFNHISDKIDSLIAEVRKK